MNHPSAFPIDNLLSLAGHHWTPSHGRALQRWLVTQPLHHRLVQVSDALPNGTLGTGCHALAAFYDAMVKGDVLTAYRPVTAGDPEQALENYLTEAFCLFCGLWPTATSEQQGPSAFSPEGRATLETALTPYVKSAQLVFMQKTMGQVMGIRRAQYLAIDRLRGEDATGEETGFSVFGPRLVPAGGRGFIQTFMHHSVEPLLIGGKPTRGDEEALPRALRRLYARIDEGDSVSFELALPPMIPDVPRQHLERDEFLQYAAFGITVPEDCQPGIYPGTISVGVNDVAIGHVTLTLRVAAADNDEKPEHVAIDEDACVYE